MDPPEPTPPTPAAPAAANSPAHRAGFVALCGRPNVGKSTLLNAMVGHELAVATEFPQTTRERLLGVQSGDGFQIVFVDTPGIHRARSALNKYMVAEAERAAHDTDLVVLLSEAPVLPDLEAAERWVPGEVATLALELLVKADRPIVLGLTKVDRVRDPRLLLPIIARWRDLHRFEAVVPLSAPRGTGLAELRDEIVGRLPEAPPYYDPDTLSDRPLRWHAAELVRAELFRQLRQELPYSCAVTIERFLEHRDDDEIEGSIHVERDSQKGMVTGRGGAMIRTILEGARRRISGLTGRPCRLRLRIVVARDWTSDPERLSALGYRGGEPR